MHFDQLPRSGEKERWVRLLIDSTVCVRRAGVRHEMIIGRWSVTKQEDFVFKTVFLWHQRHGVNGRKRGGWKARKRWVRVTAAFMYCRCCLDVPCYICWLSDEAWRSRKTFDFRVWSRTNTLTPCAAREVRAKNRKTGARLSAIADERSDLKPEFPFFFVLDSLLWLTLTI